MLRMDQRTQHPNRAWPAAAALLVVLAAAALAACGGGDTSDADSKSNKEKFQEAALEHARCMRRNGVDVPDPKPGQGGVIFEKADLARAGKAKLAAAERKCRKYFENLPEPNFSPQQAAEMREAALAHARCMREQGVDFPDPKFDGKGGAKVSLARLNPSDPAFKRADEKCRRLLPKGPALSTVEGPGKGGSSGPSISPAP